jgi:hypothetical protein
MVQSGQPDIQGVDRLSRRLFLAALVSGRQIVNANPQRAQGLTPPRIFDIERAVPALAQYRRPAIRLHPRRAEASLPANTSKMGGVFLWPPPAGEPWPFCRERDPVGSFKRFTDAESARQIEELTKPHNLPYQAIVQLRRCDFPELPWPRGMDLFQLLWCPKVHFWGNSRLRNLQSSGSKVFWRREAEANQVHSNLVASPNFPVYECSFKPEAIVEYPQAADARAEIQAALPQLQAWFDSVGPRRPGDPDAIWRYSYDIAVSPGTKLFGYPQWIQDTETPECACGRSMKLLLTCASQEDANSSIWTAQPSRDDNRNCPFGFRWGDWSNAYIFYCSVGHPIRIRTIVQSS